MIPRKRLKAPPPRNWTRPEMLSGLATLRVKLHNTQGWIASDLPRPQQGCPSREQPPSVKSRTMALLEVTDVALRDTAPGRKLCSVIVTPTSMIRCPLPRRQGTSLTAAASPMRMSSSHSRCSARSAALRAPTVMFLNAQRSYNIYRSILLLVQSTHSRESLLLPTMVVCSTRRLPVAIISKTCWFLPLNLRIRRLHGQPSSQVFRLSDTRIT